MIPSREGMLTEPKTTKALAKLLFPSTVNEMQSFFGVAKYLRFTPRLASLVHH